MSIYERIRKGSYRGAEFDIINVGRTRVKKNTEHQYANSVRRYIEERGVQNQDFTVTLSIFGSNEDYFEKRDALRTALEAEGEGVLVLPIEGEFNVKCTEFSDSQNLLETLGRCDFTCTFKVVSENEKAGNPVAFPPLRFPIPVHTHAQHPNRIAKHQCRIPHIYHTVHMNQMRKQSFLRE